MTDNEIIKALECCVYRPCNKCIRQPIEHGMTERDCKTGLMKCAFFLINRQKAEIERLTINMNAFDLGMKREKERADTVRAEAIKEFAERLKGEMLSKYCVYFDFEITNAIIDNLVKEMVGDA